MHRSTVPAWKEGKLVPVDKLEAHRQGLRHKAVSVFVIHDGRLLVQRRAASKYHTPLLWANTCCTHPFWGEQPRDCAIRRLEEELGITGLPLEHRGQVEYRADVGNGMVEHECVDIFLSEPSDEPQPEPAPDEVAETAWLKLEELDARIAQHPEQFTPWLRIYLARHRDLILGPA